MTPFDGRRAVTAFDHHRKFFCWAQPQLSRQETNADIRIGAQFLGLDQQWPIPRNQRLAEVHKFSRHILAFCSTIDDGLALFVLQISESFEDHVDDGSAAPFGP
jgi:hypothetical protein